MGGGGKDAMGRHGAAKAVEFEDSNFGCPVQNIFKEAPRRISGRVEENEICVLFVAC